MGLRRFLGAVPRLVGRTWNDITKELQDYLEKLRDSLTNGIPGGVTSQVPTIIEADVVADRGSENAGWSPGDHQHDVSVAAPVDLGEATSEGTGTPLARADHVHKLAVRVAENGVTVGTRKRINLLDGASIGWTVVDDAGSDEIDITGAVILAGITHDLLSATHSDTVASVVTKGSLVVGNSTPAWEEFPVGADGDVLTADSAEPFGVKWEAPSGGGGFWDRDAGNGWIWPTTVSDVVLIGTDVAIYGASSEIQGSVVIRRHSNVPGAGAILDLWRTGGSEGSMTAVSNGDTLGTLGFEGFDTGDAPAGSIRMLATENWGGSAHGSEMFLSTVAIGSTTVSDRLHITSAGVVQPGADDAQDLGSSTLRWNTVQAVEGRFGITSSAVAAPAYVGAEAMLNVYLDQASSSAAEYNRIIARKARGTLGTKTDVSASDVVFEIVGTAYDGSSAAFEDVAVVRIDVESNTSFPSGRISFLTGRDVGMGSTAEVLRFQITANGNLVCGAQTGSLATGATDGFFYVPRVAGTPTGAATAYTAANALCYDDAADILYIRDSGGTWRAH